MCRALDFKQPADHFDCLHMFMPFDIQRPIHQDNPNIVRMLTVRAIDFDEFVWYIRGFKLNVHKLAVWSHLLLNSLISWKLWMSVVILHFCFYFFKVTFRWGIHLKMPIIPYTGTFNLSICMQYYLIQALFENARDVAKMTDFFILSINNYEWHWCEYAIA